MGYAAMQFCFVLLSRLKTRPEPNAGKMDINGI